MPRMRLLFVAILAGFVTVPARGAETPESAVARLEDYFRLFSRCIIEFEERISVKNDRFNGDHVHTKTYRLVRDIPRWREKGVSQNYIPPERGRKGEWIRESGEAFYDGRKAFVLGLDNNKPRGGPVGWNEVTGGWQLYGPIYAVSAFIEGRLNTNEFRPLPEILRTAAVSVKTEPSRSGDQLVVEGVGRWGKHAVWMDPQRGYVPVKIVQRKGPDDWYKQDLSLGTCQVNMYGGTFRRSNEVIATATRIDVRDGRYVVMGYTLTEKDEYQNGKTWVNTYTGTVTNLNLSPKLSDADFSFQTTVPDGSPVNVVDEPGIRYEWEGGRPVKSIDQDVVHSLGGNFFARASRPTRIAIAAGLVGIAAAIVYAVRWYRRRRAA